MNKRKIAIALLGVMLISPVVTIKNSVNATAVTETHLSDWSKNEIDFLVQKALIPAGLLNKKIDFFNEDITRERFALLITQFYEHFEGEIKLTKEDDIFKDTEDESILKAAKIGVIKGKGEGLFDPEGKITREEIATMLNRLFLALEVNAPITMEWRYYADESEMSDWAKGSIQTLNKLGIIKGVGENKIDPKGYTTGEQASVMIKRSYDLTMKYKKDLKTQPVIKQPVVDM